ncbi:hypothetical protein AAG593_05525 [Citromicrobium bathyomarinum]
MAAPDLVLEFEIEEGRSPDIENVARALLAWSDAVQAAVRVIDPAAQVRVELSGVEHGSQRFKQVLRFLEDTAEAIEEGGQEYPLIFKQVKALAKLIGGGILMAVVLNEVVPDEQQEVLEEIRDLLRESPELRRHSEEFYDTLQEEPAIAVVELYEGDSEQPTYSVPRAEFAERSGLFQITEDNQPIERIETRSATWDVVLIRPVLVAKPRRWTFAKDGIEFSAEMTDTTVLTAIREKTITIPFAEGVMMKIEVVYDEEFDGAVWKPIGKSRKVVKVLSPRIMLPPGALFSHAS